MRYFAGRGILGDTLPAVAIVACATHGSNRYRPMSSRLIGILWVVAGAVLIVLAFRKEERETSLLVLGVTFVALGGAIVRRSRRS